MLIFVDSSNDNDIHLWCDCTAGAGADKQKKSSQPKVEMIRVLDGKKGENIDIAVRSSKVCSLLAPTRVM